MRTSAAIAVTPLHYVGPWRAIVVGGGHAGCEAALALARGGIATLLLTQNVDRIAWMSCNPAIGGIGKSHLVAEIDALGGEMARAADKSGVHYKVLNSSKGPAVRALRAQCDKLAYATAMRRTLEQTPNLAIKQADVRRLWLQDGRLAGVETAAGLQFSAEVVILTAGTFIGAVCHTGEAQIEGGRAGDTATLGLGDQLRALGVRTMRHKTGTCPRLDGRTIDWSRVQPDPGLEPPPPMARNGEGAILPQMPCHVTHSNAATHAVIRENVHRSPLFGGVIEGVGPRYCPSIEDKVIRFPQHETHYIFLEREGWQTDEIYVNGLSTSLPADVQIAMVRSLPGLEQAEIVRFGYAVEYDAIDARQLGRDLMQPALPGLYFAGQVNGTSGYEEAAGQGLVAGIQGLLRLRGEPPIALSRTESYLGVMVDDLVSRGADEPYRMFTSRAEHRLVLRTSNADLRLTELGRALGIVDDAAWLALQQRRARLEALVAILHATVVKPDREIVPLVESWGGGTMVQPTTLGQLLCRPEVALSHLARFLPPSIALSDFDADDQEEVTTQVRYAGYVEREKLRQVKAQKLEAQRFVDGFDFAEISGLSREALAALQRARPETLAQAARVPGVTPASVQVLSYWLAGPRRQRAAARSVARLPNES